MHVNDTEAGEGAKYHVLYNRRGNGLKTVFGSPYSYHYNSGCHANNLYFLKKK